MAVFNEWAWQHRRKHAKAWLFFTALFSMMLVSYVVIFAMLVSAYRQENRLLLEQVSFFVSHSIHEDHDNFDDLNRIDFKGRDYAVVVFSPLEQITLLSNKPQANFTASANWQVYKQKTDTTLQTTQKLEAMRTLPEGYRMYVYLSSPPFYLYHRLASPLTILPLLVFFLIVGLYLFYMNRQTRAWQSLLDYCQTLQHQVVTEFSPYPVSQRPLNLDMAQLGQAINRFGFQLNGYFHKIKALSQHQQQLIENMPLPLFMLNRKGRITYFNQQFSKEFMTPFYADAVYLLSDFIAGKDKTNQQLLLNLTTTHTAVRIAVTDLQHQHFFDLYLQPVYNSLGKVQGFSGCLQNTSHYQHELQDAWLNEKQHQDKIASFDKLWAVLGHELRTPLTGMLGMIEILDDDKDNLPSEQQEVVQTLQQSGQGMLQMLNDMLDIAKLGAGKLNTNIAQTDLFSLMRQVAELMVGNARRQQIDLLYHIDGQVPRYIETDDGRLRQILLNLLSNAVKFTKQGYVALLADLMDSNHPLIIENNLSQNPAQKWLRITIKDTGIGISESEQKKLFSFFNQANESISRQFGGTGLGLAISNSFSQLLGGFIHLDSVVGEGSEFQVYLPLKNYRPQTSFNFNINQYPFHLILIVTYEISQRYTEKLLASMKLNFSVFTGLTQENVAQINQQFDHANSPHTPFFVVDDHCYGQSPILFEQITCFNTSPKLFVTMNTERSLPTPILETFDGVLTKPISMNNFLAETTRIYDKFQQQITQGYVPLTAQEAYKQFLANLTKRKETKETNTSQAHILTAESAEIVETNTGETPSINTQKNTAPIFTPITQNQTQTSPKLVEVTAPKKSILVAEDNPVNQKIVKRHLDKLGYDVILAEDGQQAIELLHIHQSKIGLILMDCQMPIMDGLEATRIIRAEQSSVPIIALTANNGDEDRQLCLMAGMDNFLTKPLNKDELIRLLNRYMI